MILWDFEAWRLKFPWDLDFGIWDFQNVVARLLDDHHPSSH
ncbi:MAG: hypothetical protein QOE73_854 [Verrucomicrobiota bacterium]